MQGPARPLFYEPAAVSGGPLQGASMQQAEASLATAETDAELAQRERTKGAEAALAGKRRDECPWKGGLCERWWLEGFDNPRAASTVHAQ
ncbi:hypothetical protein WJ97_11150 [Burkholderia ubonensis]|nr:hypothetical protein WJ97_11150 [Burkholderia ubonensis]